MKNILLSLSVIFILAACQHKADDSTGQLVPVSPVYNNSASSDTASSEAFYQPRKYVNKPKASLAQRNLPVAVHRRIPSGTTSLPPVETSPVVKVPASIPDTVPSVSPVGNTGTETASTIPQPEKKKGWSKAAKGAVIGGATGAIGGAILSKKKGVGAIIGGVLGAAGGYAIGRGMDKKDNRFITN